MLLKYNANNKLPKLGLYLKLINKKDRNFFVCYIGWIRLLFIRGFGIKNNSTKTFNYLYKAVSKKWPKDTLLGYLQDEFIKRNLSLSLLLEPIDGFSWIAKNRYELDYIKASPMFLQIIAPISRMVAVLNNCKPPFYQPFSNLLFAYLSLYLIYSPNLVKIFKNNKISIQSNVVNKELPHIFNEAKFVIPTSSSLYFKFKLGFFLSLYKVLLKKGTKDLKKINYVNSFLYGLYYTLTIKSKKIKLNQI